MSPEALNVLWPVFLAIPVCGSAVLIVGMVFPSTRTALASGFEPCA